MEVSIIFKIAAVGILVSVLSQVLKHSGREEQAFLVSLAGLLVVLFCIFNSPFFVYKIYIYSCNMPDSSTHEKTGRISAAGK